MLELGSISGHSVASSITQERQLRGNNIKPSLSSHTKHRKTPRVSKAHPEDTKLADAHQRSVNNLPAYSYFSASHPEQRTSISPANIAPMVHYTRTGRISKAKKGLKVHACECGKSYTRAEHLRRHQKNHLQDGTLVCDFPDCERTFFRADLLQRHQERHDIPGEGSPLPSEIDQDEPLEPFRSSEPMAISSSTTATLLPATHYHPLQPVSSTHESAEAPRYIQNSFRTPQLPRTPRVPSLVHSHVVRSSPITSSPNHSRSQSFYTGRQSISVPVSIEGIPHHTGWSDSYGQSPGYSSSSGYASPILGAGDYANMFATPNYGSGSCRTRTSSNASYIEPWSYQSQSPMSCTSTMPHMWTSNEKTLTASGFSYMAASDSFLNMPIPGDVDNMVLYGQYGPQTMAMRDDEDELVLFPNQPHGMDQITHVYPSKNFLDNYWRLFHPTFPIVHRSTFESVSPSPMLHAAMIAVGGHYSTDASVRRKSRILHERCIELLERRHRNPLASFERLCDYQAIFLVELLSQYLSRRVSRVLSPRFELMYHKMAEDVRDVTSKIAEITFSVTQPESNTVNQWNRWIQLSTQQRLFLSCYIMDYQQAILLAREPRDSFFQEPGMNLPIPTHSSAWGSSSAAEWVVAVQQNPYLPTYVFETDSNLTIMPFDPFQSSVMLAAHYNHFGTRNPYLALTTTINVEQYLDASPITRHRLLTAKLLQVTPIRALLAVSGESWILFEKITAPRVLSTLRSTLRVWISQLWSTSTAEPYTVPVREALRISISILQQALTEGPDYLTHGMGSGMSLYFAALVVWVTTVAARTRVMRVRQVATRRLQPQSSLPIDPGTVAPIPPASTQLSTFDPSLSLSSVQPGALGLILGPHAQPSQASPSNTAALVPHSELNKNSISFLSTAFQDLSSPASPSTIMRCQTGSTNLLLWVKHLHGVQSPTGAHVGSGDEGHGELLNSVISSLRRILDKSWEEWRI
ncbi:hypothetical protein P153DRAFT_380904 [Dothidotthia symphoricarpi CBS 119687]|uniref:C2H2-type domain-containing protein n=1 Tax=Dothidotthia symphoricarpi CBS 119687 TaxID=1392245 RepID=A0A6A6AQ96_9PLEO|nr:uncharacterized protein P153DRAFT_380904 [Dothidotthia symphoricarpi CBS 119687]KAF2133716.1 hypothetical protein P153DRAFT_380904 [Dothidotthia symphoricarpi CBS 119687]